MTGDLGDIGPYISPGLMKGPESQALWDIRYQVHSLYKIPEDTRTIGTGPQHLRTLGH